MNNKAFTLIEMIATVMIISLLTLLVVPAVINQITNKRGEIDNATKKIIYEAAELYMSNNSSEYPKITGNSYCISLDKIVEAGFIDAPIKDFKTGKEISISKKINVKVNSYKEYDSFSIVDNC
ncbi:MAG: prepilin-type N-terminal cleavage/methylation domain-containing protein [Bacilli bacterium]|nr:prepilin-type N-terminal cleavage/methylation domain-containing protein [Bacilli bacterium]